MNLWRKPFFFFFPSLPLLRRAKRIRARSLYAEGVGDGQMDLHACFNIQIRVSFPTVQFFFFGLVWLPYWVSHGQKMKWFLILANPVPRFSCPNNGRQKKKREKGRLFLFSKGSLLKNVLFALGACPLRLNGSKRMV